MSDCIFCKIVKGEIPSHKVYEDDGYLAFLDIKPINPGHTLIISKTHTKDLLDTPDETLHGLIERVKKIAPAILKATGAEGFNLGVNNGASAGQIVFHLHFHIMPRKNLGEYKLWGGRDYAPGQAEKVVNEIKESLSL